MYAYEYIWVCTNAALHDTYVSYVPIHGLLLLMSFAVFTPRQKAMLPMHDPFPEQHIAVAVWQTSERRKIIKAAFVSPFDGCASRKVKRLYRCSITKYLAFALNRRNHHLVV
jgi:hypothetical protein